MNYIHIAIAAVVAFFATALAGWFILPVLRKLKLKQMIKQDGPSWHNQKQGTPTMGGIMFIIGIFLAVVAAAIGQILKGDTELLRMLIMPLGFGAIGFIDDFTKVIKKQNMGLTASQKMLFQIIVTAVYLLAMYLSGSMTTQLFIPIFNVSFDIGVFYYLFAAFAIIAMVNAVNITDGIDGLATTVTMVVAVFFTASSVLFRSEATAIYSAAAVGALAGFLIFNAYPAKVFMGDTGSLFLGGIVCAMAFSLNIPLILIIIGIIYIIETLSDILQVIYFRATHGKRLFKMAPFHHHLEMCGWREKKIVAVFAVITAIACVFAFVTLYIYVGTI